MGKLTSFLISLVLVSVVVGIFSIFFSQMREGYGEQTGMNESDLAVLNKMENLTSSAEELQDNINTFSEKDNPFDVIGNFFSSAWGSVKLAAGSVNLVAGDDGIIYTLSDKADLGEGGKILRTGIITIMILFVVVGILISALIKKDV